MFDTNIDRIVRPVTCDDDCKQSGCSGHIVEIRINSTAGAGAIYKDGEYKYSFDRNEAEAILSMLKEIKEDTHPNPIHRALAIVHNSIPPAKLEDMLGIHYEEFKKLTK